MKRSFGIAILIFFLVAPSLSFGTFSRRFDETYEASFSNDAISVTVDCALSSTLSEDKKLLSISCEKEFGVYKKEVAVTSELNRGKLVQTIAVHKRVLFFPTSREGLLCLDRASLTCREFSDRSNDEENRRLPFPATRSINELSLVELYEILKTKPEDIPRLLKEETLPLFYKSRYDLQLVELVYLNPPDIRIKYRVIKVSPEGGEPYGELVMTLDQDKRQVTHAIFEGPEFRAEVRMKKDDS